MSYVITPFSGEPNDKSRAAFRSGVDVDAAAVSFDNAPDHCEPQAIAGDAAFDDVRAAAKRSKIVDRSRFGMPGPRSEIEILTSSFPPVVSKPTRTPSHRPSDAYFRALSIRLETT